MRGGRVRNLMRRCEGGEAVDSGRNRGRVQFQLALYFGRFRILLLLACVRCRRNRLSLPLSSFVAITANILASLVRPPPLLFLDRRR